MPRSRLSVLHVCAPAEFGGLERVVQALSIGFAERGHAVTVVAVVEPRARTGPFLTPMSESGVDVIRLEVGRRAYLKERREVRAVMEDLRPAVLHTHGHRSDLLHPATARRRGIATVTTLHGFSSMGGLHDLFEWIQKRSLRAFDGVVAVSCPLQGMLERMGISERRLHLVPNAWTPVRDAADASTARARLGIPEGVPVMGWVGRMVPIKGADVFVEALGMLPNCDWVACIVGDGPQRSTLERRAEELGVGDRVVFAGAVPDAPRLYQAFDLFVLSSRSEGTPMALLEAVGEGVCAVATEVGGVPDVLKDGSGGWLVPPESPSELASVLMRAMSHPQEVARRAERGRQRVQDYFGPGQWLDRHEEVYRSAIAERSVGGGSPSRASVEARS